MRPYLDYEEIQRRNEALHAGIEKLQAEVEQLKRLAAPAPGAARRATTTPAEPEVTMAEPVWAKGASV